MSPIQTTNEISVTVGVLTRDSARTITHTLRSLKLQTYPKSSWETVFIDHNSSDLTRQHLETYVSEAPGSRLVSLSENNVAASRQRILEASRARWVAFVDSDVVLPETWLEDAVSFAERASSSGSSKFAGVGSPLRIVALSENLSPIERLQTDFAGHAGTEQLSPATVTRKSTHLPTSAALFSREGLLAAGGFRESMHNCGEDLELGTRLTGLGHELWIEPKLESIHHLSCTSLSGWCRRAFRFGRARIRVATLHPRLWIDKQIAVPLSLAVLEIAVLVVAVAKTKPLFAVGFACAHLLALTFLLLDARRPLQGARAALLAWATHQAYAFGELYEFVLVTFRATDKGAARARS